MKQVFIIAEIGVNHNGSLSKAYKLISEARKAGANAVKFQSFIAEKIVTKFAKKADYQIDSTTMDKNQFNMLKKLEIDFEFQKKIFRFAKNKKIHFLSSPFDLDSIEFLSKLNLNIFKIPSGEITNIPYLKKIGKLKKKIILSTGCSKISEIKIAIDLLNKFGTPKKNITLLHCTSAYPAPLNQVNLNSMSFMKNKFNVNVGYSDHTIGFEVPIAAVAAGAVIIEKHFTLNRNMRGPDHKVSLNPKEFKQMVVFIRNIEKTIGKYDKFISKSELKNINKIRKSIYASRSIKKGEIFTSKNITTKRPDIYISASKWDKVIGKIASRNYNLDEPINE